MSPWPEITDPEAGRQLALGDASFLHRIDAFLDAVGPRTYTPEALEHALGYPWARPERSYVLHDGTVDELHALDAEARAAVLDRFLSTGTRTPLLAIGSNAAPATLRRKLAHLPPGPDRDVLVVAGHLHDFDVGASAHLALYGSIPATIFPSPGTAVRTAILWTTPTQFTALIWTELSYALGRLATRFEADEPEHTVDEVTVFVSRFGAWCPDGEPLALAALPARDRTAKAQTQESLMRRAASEAFGAGPQELVENAFADFGATARRLHPVVRERGRRFVAAGWTPYPAG